MSEKDNYYRSILKSLSWRVVANLTTLVIAYLFTKEIAITLGIGAVEVVSKFFIYHFHERFWNSLDWGKNKYN